MKFTELPDKNQESYEMSKVSLKNYTSVGPGFYTQFACFISICCFVAKRGITSKAKKAQVEPNQVTQFVSIDHSKYLASDLRVDFLMCVREI